MAIYTVWKAKRKGRKDGRDWRWTFWPLFKTSKPVFPDDSETKVTPYEKSIKDGAEKDIAKIKEEFYKIDGKLKQRYCSLEKAEKDLSAKLPKEKKEAEDAEQNFKDIQDQLARLGEPVIKAWVVKLILLLFMITEFPLNAMVFAIFGEGRFMTYFMAGVICFGIPLGAHYVGKVLKQELKSKNDISFATFITLVTIIVIVGIAVLRADYLSYVLSRYNLNIKMSSTTAAVIFVGINVFLFCLAAFISYLGTHENNEEYQRLKQQLKIVQQRLEKENREAIKIITELEEVTRELAEIRAKRECLANHYYFKGVQIKEVAENLIQIYRYANLETRPSNVVPRCFKIDLNIPAPDDIKNVDWNCD